MPLPDRDVDCGDWIISDRRRPQPPLYFNPVYDGVRPDRSFSPISFSENEGVDCVLFRQFYIFINAVLRGWQDNFHMFLYGRFFSAIPGVKKGAVIRTFALLAFSFVLYLDRAYSTDAAQAGLTDIHHDLPPLFVFFTHFWFKEKKSACLFQ